MMSSRTSFKIGGATGAFLGHAGRCGAARATDRRSASTCEPSRGDPAQCPGAHSGRADFLKAVLTQLSVDVSYVELLADVSHFTCIFACSARFGGSRRSSHSLLC